MVKDRPLVFVKLFPQGEKSVEKQNTRNKSDSGKWLGVPFALPKQRKKPSSGPLDLTDKLLSFRYEDEERKADKCEITIDNYDLSEFDNPWWKKGGILEVTWGYPGSMTPPRRVVIQKIKGSRELTVEAQGLEVLMNKVKAVKVHKGKSLHQLATEVAKSYQGAFMAKSEFEEAVQKPDSEVDPPDFTAWYDRLKAWFYVGGKAQYTRRNYDYRGLFRDIQAGKVPDPMMGVNRDPETLPAQYRRSVANDEESFAEGFKSWYAQLASKYNLDPNPDDKRHFYDYRRLYRDVRAAKTPDPLKTGKPLPEAYRRGLPSMWVRESEGGQLIDAKTGKPVSDAEMEKVANSLGETAERTEPGQRPLNIDEQARQVKINHAVQSAQTDAQFLSKVAKKYGYRFYIDQKGFHLTSVDAVYKKKPEKTITWFNGDGEWLDFEYENDGTEKPDKVKARGIDPNSRSVFERTGSDEETKRNGLAPRIREMHGKTGVQTMTDRTPGSFKEEVAKHQAAESKAGGVPRGREEEEDLSPSSSSDPVLAKQTVDGKYKKRKGHSHELTGTLIGDPMFLAKSILRVEGIGRRLSGNWAVKKVKHVIDGSGGYTCEFEAERDGDNGYGEKGEGTSKAAQPKTDLKDAKPQMLRKWDQKTGVFTITTRDPNNL